MAASLEVACRMLRGLRPLGLPLDCRRWKQIGRRPNQLRRFWARALTTWALWYPPRQGLQAVWSRIRRV